MGFFYKLVCQALVNPFEYSYDLCAEEISAGFVLIYTNGHPHIRRWDMQLSYPHHMLQGTVEACGISGRKQLLGINPGLVPPISAGGIISNAKGLPFTVTLPERPLLIRLWLCIMLSSCILLVVYRLRFFRIVEYRKDVTADR